MRMYINDKILITLNEELQLMMYDNQYLHSYLIQTNWAKSIFADDS